MEFKFVISDPKTGKSYQKALNNEWFVGKKIGDKVEGNLVGLKKKLKTQKSPAADRISL